MQVATPDLDVDLARRRLGHGRGARMSFEQDAVSLTGAVVSLVLVASRRAGWRTALPFGPPLLVGAVLALALQGPVAVG